MKRLVLGFRAGKYLRRFLFVLLSLPLIAAQLGSARAADDAQAADTAVQLFVAAANATGLPITQQEAVIITQIVTCGTANGANVGDCAKNAAIKVILQEAGVNKQTQDLVASAVGCLGSKTSSSVASCAAQTVASLVDLPAAAKPAIDCIVGGGNIVDCGKKLAIGVVLDKVPPEIQPVASCVISGGPSAAPKCTTDFVTQQIVGHLPADMQDQAKAVATCLGKPDAGTCVATAVASGIAGPQVGDLAKCASAPNVGECVANFASANMPALPTVNGVDPNAVAKALVKCAGSPDFDACVTQAGVKQAKDVATNVVNQAGLGDLQTALATIAKLRPGFDAVTIDAGVTSGNMATLQNILMVADGIKNGNMAEIIVGGGTEIAIAASNIILSIFLTPAVANLLSPAVAAMIHNDEAAGLKALAAIKAGDPVELAKVLFTWYETQFFDKPCALLGDNDVRNTVCGALSDAVKLIADNAGDLAHKLLSMGEDVLKWLGVWGTVDELATKIWNTVSGAIDDIGHFFGLGDAHDDWKPPAECASKTYAQDYFANNYLACVTPATNSNVTGGLAGGISALKGACMAAMDKCINPKQRSSSPDSKESTTCDAMGKSLGDVANQVSAAMGTAADLYQNSIGPASYVSDQFQKAKDNGLAFGVQKGMPDFCSPSFWVSYTPDMKMLQIDEVSKCSAFVTKQFPSVNASAPNTCSAFRTSTNSQATAACSNSFRATIDASAATGQGLTGPGSTFCKAQQDLIKNNPCKFTKPDILIDPQRGIYIHDITGLVCDGQFKKPPFDTGPGVPQLIPPGGTYKPFPGGMQRPDQVLFPPQGSSGWNGVNNNTNEGTRQTFPGGIPRPGDTLLPPRGSSGSGTVKSTGPKATPPILGALPKTGNSSGSSGASMINGCSGNSPAAGCPPSKRQRVIRVPRGRPVVVDRGPPNAGSSGSNSAMDRLGGGMGNLDAISGNRTFTSGPAKIDVPRRVGHSGGSSGASTSKPIPSSSSSGSSGASTSRPIPGSGGGGPVKPSSSSGGSSGYSTSKGGNAGGSSGISTSRPISSGGSSGISTSRPTTRSPAPRNDPIDYGGCAGCGQRKDDLIVR